MANGEQYGLFLPTTEVWDVGPIYEANIENEALVLLLVRLYQNINNIAIGVNLKDTGYYVQSEFVNGQVFFPNPAYSSITQTAPSERQVYRKVIDFGTLPNTMIKSVAHEIIVSSVTTFTRIYATASDTTGFAYIPIPFVDASGNGIQLDVDATNVNITTTSDRTNFDTCYVILEWMQQ